MRRTSFHSRQPRRGQALLLAVLIMIFAALLSASFIALVSVNLNQTARQTDKNRAVVSARAGLDYVRNQLAYSNEGPRWRPTTVSQIPAPTDPNYSFYYTALDRAQGWAGTYAKFPDPRNATNQLAGPQFLAKVERVDALPMSDPDRVNPNLLGATRISVIGLSPEDPTAYARSTAYFGGYKNSPVGQTMRTVSNWDFVAQKPLVAQANPVAVGNGDGTVTGVLNVTNAQGNFTSIATPFAITISNPRRGTPARSAVVFAATNSVFTLATPLAMGAGAVAGDRIELAANMGAPIGIDYDNNATTVPTAFNATTATTTEPGLFRLSDGPVGPLTDQVDGIRVNSGLVWTGDLLTTKLRPVETAFSASRAPGGVFASGVMAFDPTTSTQVNFAKATDSGPLGTLQPSATTGIFSANADYSIASDGWNRLSGQSNTNATRNVPDFTPPVIDSGDAVERYRNLTRFSKANPASINPNPPIARSSFDGYGEGIYIDNFQDREKKTGAGAIPVELTQTEYVKMLFGSPVGTPAAYERNGTPAAANIVTASLEEQHLRGWVGPDEFRARGVEIELSNVGVTPVLFITRDARDDNKGTTTNALGPVTEKAWKKSLNGTADTGVYRKMLPWPANGMIFAEGNIRIKGQALYAPRSLTVVSMNNIYIEDSLTADDFNDGVTVGQPRKVLLAARKNVVMNPTRVMGRPDAQTIYTATAPAAVAVGGTATLQVADASDFRTGDLIETSSVVAGTDTLSSTGQITSINSPTSITVAVTSAPGGPGAQVVVASSIRDRGERAVTSITPYTTIKTAADAIQRRFTVPVASPTLRVGFNEAAERITGMNVKTDAIAPGTKPTSGIFLTNKRVLDAGGANFVPAATLVGQSNKQVRGDYGSPAPGGTDPFPAATPTTEALAQGQSLDVIAAEMALKTHIDAPNGIGWKYTTAPTTGYGTLPFYYLAGIGNRYDYGSASPLTPGPGLAGWQNNILNSDIAATAAGYNVPVATSISLCFNGPTPSPVLNENWNGTTYDQTAAFGFDPNFLDASSTPNQEDVLTSDQSFYQNITSATDPVKSTLDSRAFVTPVVAGVNTLTLRQNPVAAGVLATAALPEFRMLGMKVEDVTLTMSTSNTSKIAPARTFNINAFVYAQTGSWLVIPGSRFEPRLRGDSTRTYLDTNNNNTADSGEFLDASPTGFSANDYADLNRDGTIQDSEKYAMIRYSRYNYQINFVGAISENQTALVSDAGTGATAVRGAVTDWMTKWATTQLDVAPVAPATQFTNDRIRYLFDPTVVFNSFQQDDPSTAAIDETDYGFRLPFTPQVFNVS